MIYNKWIVGVKQVTGSLSKCNANIVTKPKPLGQLKETLHEGFLELPQKQAKTLYWFSMKRQKNVIILCCKYSYVCKNLQKYPFVRLSWVYRATVPFSTCNLRDRTNIILLLALVRFAPYCRNDMEALRGLLPEGSGGAMRHIITIFRCRYAPCHQSFLVTTYLLLPEGSCAQVALRAQLPERSDVATRLLPEDSGGATHPFNKVSWQLWVLVFYGVSSSKTIVTLPVIKTL
jgi:hypothetical protein